VPVLASVVKIAGRYWQETGRNGASNPIAKGFGQGAEFSNLRHNPSIRTSSSSCGIWGEHLKIPWGSRPVRVRFPPPAPTKWFDRLELSI